MKLGKITEEKLQEVLVAGKYLSDTDLKSALRDAKKKNLPLADYLVGYNLLTKDLIGQAVAEHFGVPYADLNSNPPARDVVRRIPETFARQYRAVIFRESDDGRIIISTDNPAQSNIQAKAQSALLLAEPPSAVSAKGKGKKERRKIIMDYVVDAMQKNADTELVKQLLLKAGWEKKGVDESFEEIVENESLRDKLVKKMIPAEKMPQVTIAYSLPEDIDASFIHYRKELKTQFAQIIEKEKRVAPEIIDYIFGDAFAHRASDVHFEPQEKEVIVRFRVDGVLREAGRIPKQYYDNVLNRVKIDANLRVDEHFSAQDGAMRFENERGKADMRVSIVPTIQGEKIAIRILAEYISGGFTLDDLGLTPEGKKMIVDAARKPFGMILTTGPTGSGKTTTLYALIKLLRTPEINITTIEDPVEFKLPGINQIPVNKRTDLTFAKGLRSIVRQDPDVILVGEIRDAETAQISVNAALTGHLLFSTFHANDAATGIPRLLDMGVEPFLLASTLELIIAQRLVRKICDICRYSYRANIEELEELFPQARDYFGGSRATLYRGKACPECNYSGYKGRTALFEILPIGPEMKDLILGHPTAQEVWEVARKTGAQPLFEDGIAKVKRGVTTIEEVLRVSRPPAARLSKGADGEKE